MKKFEIVWSGDKVGDSENSIVNLEELKKITLEIAIENEFELVDGEGWIKYFNHGKLINDGYSFESWKDNVDNIVAEHLCYEILGVLETEVYAVYDEYKLLTKWTAVIPNTDKDNDQVLYQMGFSSSAVSDIHIYKDNKHIASFGSIVYGEQDVRCYYDENDNEKLVPIGMGDEYRLHEEPHTLVKAIKLQKEMKKDYLYYGNNCWLETYFKSPNGADLSKKSDQLQADSECVYGLISEGINISSETVKEISIALNK